MINCNWNGLFNTCIPLGDNVTKSGPKKERILNAMQMKWNFDLSELQELFQQWRWRRKLRMSINQQLLSEIFCLQESNGGRSLRKFERLDLCKQVLLIEFLSEPKRTLPEYNHVIFLSFFLDWEFWDNCERYIETFETVNIFCCWSVHSNIEIYCKKECQLRFSYCNYASSSNYIFWTGSCKNLHSKILITRRDTFFFVSFIYK